MSKCYTIQRHLKISLKCNLFQIVMLEVQKKKKLTTKPNSKKLVKLTQCFQIHGKRPVTMPVKMSKMATKITIISTILIIWMLPRCSRHSLGVVLECIMLTNIILVDLVLVTLLVLVMVVTKCQDLSFNLAESFFLLYTLAMLMYKI